MSWDNAEKQIEAGPRSALMWGLKAVACLMLVGFVLGILGDGLGWFSGAAKVATKEFSAQAMLDKYEWFKDAAARLDAMHASIEVSDHRKDGIISGYANVPRNQWTRDDRQEVAQIETETAGMKAAYNLLAADYNARMAKFNYAFANRGQLPAGADQVLPREFRSYEVQ